MAAKPLGSEVIVREQALDQLFAKGGIGKSSMVKLIADALKERGAR
jgi:hypothetical protein